MKKLYDFVRVDKLSKYAFAKKTLFPFIICLVPVATANQGLPKISQIFMRGNFKSVREYVRTTVKCVNLRKKGEGFKFGRLVRTFYVLSKLHSSS